MGMPASHFFLSLFQNVIRAATKLKIQGKHLSSALLKIVHDVKRITSARIFTAPIVNVYALKFSYRKVKGADTLTTMLKNNKIDGQLIVCFATYRQYRLEMAMFRLLHCWSSVSFETTRKEGEILPPVGDHDI